MEKKKVEIIVYTNPSNPHQSGIVVSGGGYYPQNTQFNGKTLSRPSDLIILGAIGENERVNRDSKRVLEKTGCMYSLKAHIALEPPLVMRKYERDKRTSRNG